MCEGEIMEICCGRHGVPFSGYTGTMQAILASMALSKILVFTLFSTMLFLPKRRVTQMQFLIPPLNSSLSILIVF